MRSYFYFSAFAFSLLMLTTVYGATLMPIQRAPSGAVEGITHDPVTGNYIITYLAEDELRPRGLYQTIYIPATKTDPTVKTTVKLQQTDDTIAYRFNVKNRAGARQNLRMLITTVASIRPGPTSPENWEATAVDDAERGRLRVSWTYDGPDELGGLKPGTGSNAFGMESDDLPGIGMIQCIGATPVQAYVGDGPRQEIAEQKAAELDKRNFTPRPAALPLIPVPDPFEAGPVLTDLKAHVPVLVELRQLDPTLGSQLERGLQVAIERLNRGDRAAGRDELKALRQLIARQHHGAGAAETLNRQTPITRLAAEVLAFDLRYVEGRLKKE